MLILICLNFVKYFNEHIAYFNLNCKKVYRFEWESGERREKVCAFIVNWTDCLNKKNTYLTIYMYIVLAFCNILDIVGKNQKAHI